MQPPPPGYAPTPAQLAAQQGQTVVMKRERIEMLLVEGYKHVVTHTYSTYCFQFRVTVDVKCVLKCDINML